MLIMRLFFEVGRMVESHVGVQVDIKDTCFSHVKLRILLDV